MNEAIDILGLDSESLGRMAREILPSGAGVAPAVFEEIFETGKLSFQGLGLSARSEEAWERAFSLKLPEVLRLEEDETGTAKAVLGFADGSKVECVHIPMPGGNGGKATLCLSSQVGCRMGCAFCETGRSGLSRNLKASEIVAEVVTARHALGWNFGNLVFMGMGECLDNLDEVAKALKVLSDNRGFGFGQDRITLCTSGPKGSIEKLRELGLKRLGLSISLNAANDQSREKLMPVNRGNSLESLARSLHDYPMRKNFAIGVNWCLIPGINDSPRDAAEASEFCRKIGRCIVNLIPYNPGSCPIGRAPTEEEVEAFSALLTASGCAVKRRISKGASIMAGCGQLGGPQIP